MKSVSDIPQDIEPILTELKGRLREFYGDKLSRIVLFGSRARGDNDPDSDIDLLVVLKLSPEEVEQVPYPIDLVSELLDRYDLLVTILEMDEGRFQKGDGGPFLRNVKKEGLTIN